MNARLELLQQVFLMATESWLQKNNLMGRAGAIVGDVERIAISSSRHDLAFFLGDVFADDNHAIGLLAERGGDS